MNKPCGNCHKDHEGRTLCVFDDMNNWEEEFAKKFHKMTVTWDEEKQAYIWPQKEVEAFIKQNFYEKKMVEELLMKHHAVKLLQEFLKLPEYK